jgi:hypothetical protein
MLATPLIDWGSVGKIVLAAIAGGAGVVVAFGLLLLAIQHAGGARSLSYKLANFALGGLAGAFCIGAVVIGIYAMAKKPSSKPAAPATTNSSSGTKAPAPTP